MAEPQEEKMLTEAERQHVMEIGAEIFDLLQELPDPVHAANAMSIAHTLLIEAVDEEADEAEVREMMGQMTEAVVSHMKVRHQKPEEWKH